MTTTFQMQIEVGHPVLFLSNSAPDVSIPVNTGQTFAAATIDCISFWVLSHVDGASLVTIADRACEAEGKKLFNGSISVSSGMVTLSDSGAFHYINVPVQAGAVSVEIWADNETSPTWVWIKLGAIRTRL